MRLDKLSLWTSLVLLTTAWGATAQAEPLSLFELADFNAWVQCSEACGQLPPSPTFEQQRTFFRCQSDCGNARRLWEKNGVEPIDRHDLELAILETQHATQPPEEPLVCYQGEADEVVVRGALCAEDVCQLQPECSPAQCALPVNQELDCTNEEPGGARCWWPNEVRPPACPDVVCDAQPDRDEDDCADADEDGIPAWLEDEQGLSDLQAQALCGGLEACAFDEACVFDDTLGVSQCAPRDCNGQPCTLFHLEVIAEDDQQALVWVYFDHSALPTRVLDLYLTYDRDALALEDARPLAALSEFGKTLRSTHLSDGTLRLSVFGTNATDPIAHGPIIELIFRRTAEESGAIAFTDNTDLRQGALAPEQGLQQETLAEDQWWGQDIELTPRSALSTRLALWYGFESLDAPLSYANIPSAQDLCDDIAQCANEEDAPTRQRFIALLEQLQRGTLVATDSVEGVTASGAYFDGENDHLRMPVAVQDPYDPSAQHLSFSTWFYPEGNTTNELRDTPQILYTHNGFDERTRWGLMLRPNEDGGVDLNFFNGDFLSKTPPPEEVTLASNLPLRRWQHVALTLNAATGQVLLYFNGEQAATVTLEQPPSAVACPQLVGGTDLRLHLEGDIIGGKPSEAIYMGVSQGGLFKVLQMDLQGVAPREILGDGQFSYRDPDYSPILNKIVYASNVSGAYEIWIADGDGSNARQITTGFGDPVRNIAARRPRWSPDGTGIVFESNIFDVDRSDNNFARVWHLYYIGYDPNADAVSVELPGGGTANQLDYRQAIEAQAINLYRLTHRDQTRNHIRASWLEGSGDGNRGILLMETSSERFDEVSIEELVIAQNIPSTNANALPGLAEPGQEVALLAAHRSVRPAFPEPIETRTVFFKRSRIEYLDNDQFTLTQTDTDSGVAITVTHNPNGYDARCWDKNTNNVQEADEDTNEDGAWNEADCHPFDVRNLYIEFDPAVWRPVLVDEDGQYLTPGPLLAPQNEGGVHKDLQLKESFPFGRAVVRVEVLSPFNALPIPAGDIATVSFERVDLEDAEVDFAPLTRDAQEELFIKDLTTNDPPAPYDPAGRFEQIEEALFSPDGQELLLAVISRARPLLLRSASLQSAAESVRISRGTLRLRGMSWSKQDNFYACNWAGGYLQPFDKEVLSSLRGGLDDMKFYHGIRSAESLRSEFERGLERLEQEERLEGDSLLAQCNGSNADCPDFHLCINSECVMIDCDPDDPYSCNDFGGSCVQRPTSVEQENAQLVPDSDFFDWVCAVDCNSDRQCFTQECLNGPCRFCQEETCVECREVTTDYGAFSLTGIEGCPDRNSFACVEGACVTECYAFDDGQSRYLCDPATEYCQQGRCVLLDWDWPDLAPASFVGLSDARYNLPPNQWQGYSAAVGESFPIEIYAYGVSDHTHAPEVVVEAKGGPLYGNTWTRLGKAVINNKTRAQAGAKPIIIDSPYPYESIRLRMVNSPYQNLTAAANGLRENDSEFCIKDIRQSAIARGENPLEADFSPCFRRAPGSMVNIGYRLGLPMHEAIKACRERGHAGCPGISQGDHDYLYGGANSVVITDLKAAGGQIMGNITQNTVCTYEGSLDPLNDDGSPRKLFYGDITTEQSNQQADYCQQNPEACQAPTAPVVEFNPEQRGFALLNCNLYDPIQPETRSAQIVVEDIAIVREWPARRGAIIFDDGNTCRVELDGLRSQPCYEWDTDASLDSYNMATVQHGTLEFGLFRSFGHDRGFGSVPLPRHAFNVRITGYDGQGLVLENRGERLEVNTAAEDQTVAFAQTFTEGMSYSVKIVSQPTDPALTCVLQGESAGNMPNAPVTVTLECLTRQTLGGTVAGLADDASALLRLTTTDERGADQSLEQLINANGAFEFTPGVIEGRAWALEIAQQPRTQECTVAPTSGTMGQAPDNGVTITCEDLPFRNLGVAVAGLRNPGELELFDRISGQTLTVAINGRTNFPLPILIGQQYDIAITAQPAEPPQICVFLDDAQAGVMPDQDHIGARIACAEQPTFAVTTPVTGLEGDGLRLSLNDGEEIIDVAAPNNLEAPQATFARRLLNGQNYKVTVDRQPTSPEQTCSVLLGEGVIEGSDTVFMSVICETVTEDNFYTIGGTVTGLAGQDLTLENQQGALQVTIDDNGAFEFPNRVSDNSDYSVRVRRQPREPAQNCRVLGGEGTVRGANITDIQVVCDVGSTLTVEVNRAESAGASVKVLVFKPQPGAAVVGNARQDTAIGAEQASSAILSPGSNDVAILEPGRYDVLVFINHDGSVDEQSGAATFSTADFGGRRTVELRPNEDNFVRFFASDFTPLVESPIQVRAGLDIDPDATLSCWFAPAGAGQIELPEDRNSPVVDRAVASCDGDPCFERPTIFDPFYLAVTNTNPALPRGQYDITCLADEDGDATVDSGEFTGLLSNASVRGRTIELRLEEAP